MMFTKSTIAAAAAAVVFASPCTPAPTNTKIEDGDAFTVLVIKPGSELDNKNFQAANSGFYINTPKQNASCSEDVNYATFKLDNTSLFLNTANPPQQIVTDRSGFGQGVMQYTTGVQSIGKRQQRGPFGIDANGNLVFVGQGINPNEGFLACPNAFPSGYSIWIGNNPANNPGFNKGCVSIVARAVKAENPVSCSYTQNV